MTRIPAIVLAMCISLSVRAGGDPGDGHTHGAADAAPPVPDAPRATATSEDFELVAVAAAGMLRLYLDRYDTNAPVTGARVEVESGDFRAMAHEAEPGLYTVPGDAFAGPGRHPLSVTVETGHTADLLAATLDLGGAAAQATAAASPLPAVWAGAAGLLIGGAALALHRRRKGRA